MLFFTYFHWKECGPWLYFSLTRPSSEQSILITSSSIFFDQSRAKNAWTFAFTLRTRLICFGKNCGLDSQIRITEVQGQYQAMTSRILKELKKLVSFDLTQEYQKFLFLFFLISSHFFSLFPSLLLSQFLLIFQQLRCYLHLLFYFFQEW